VIDLQRCTASPAAAGQVSERLPAATHSAPGPPGSWSPRKPSRGVVVFGDINRVEKDREGDCTSAYVILDHFSRYVTLVCRGRGRGSWRRDCLTDGYRAETDGADTRSADRGGHVSKRVPSCWDSVFLRSHSRPETSNDNPDSEAQFKP